MLNTELKTPNQNYPLINSASTDDNDKSVRFISDQKNECLTDKASNLPKKIKLQFRRCTHKDESAEAKAFLLLKQLISENMGTISNQQKELVLEVEDTLYSLQEHLLNTEQYDALFGVTIESTEIPSLIRSKKIIPTVRAGTDGSALDLTLETHDNAYSHYLNNSEMPIKSLPLRFTYNPDVLKQKESFRQDTSMLMVRMYEIGYTSGTPRYICTQGLGPCLCVVLFDSLQSKSLLGHFTAEALTEENLSELLEFCKHNNFNNIECHVLGGDYQSLGVENGFVNLKKFLDDNNISINQIFIGDTEDRPAEVVLDTKDMTLYKLDFYLRIPIPVDDLIARMAQPKLAGNRFLTKDFSVPLMEESCK